MAGQLDYKLVVLLVELSDFELVGMLVTWKVAMTAAGMAAKSVDLRVDESVG